MTKREYKRRAGALRKLTRKLRTEPSNRKVIEYSFGAMVDPGTTLWHIYNYNTNNCIATVNFIDDSAIIRYRAKSHYAGVLKEFQYEVPTIAVKSSHLSDRSRWLRDNLRSKVQHAFRMANATVPRSRLRSRTLTHERIEQLMQMGQGYYRDSRGRLRDNRGRYARATQDTAVSASDSLQIRYSNYVNELEIHPGAIWRTTPAAPNDVFFTQSDFDGSASV